MSGSTQQTVAEIPLDRGARVHLPGWQSWSPTGTYALGEQAPQAADARTQEQFYRPGRPAPQGVFQGDGWLAYAPVDGPALLWHGSRLDAQVPVLHLAVQDGRVVVTADGEVTQREHAGGLAAVVETFADELGAALGAPAPRGLQPGWSSWFGYGQQVSPAALADEIAIVRREALPVHTVQVDDGWFRSVGDWDAKPEFGSVPALADLIRDAGLELGLWSAPFLVDLTHSPAARHPDWLVGRAPLDLPFWGDGGVGVLDVTHPGAAAHLQEQYAALAAAGTTLHKIDFLYAGALEGTRHADCTAVEAYRHGLALVREAVGAQATLLGCGAPLLASIGLVDAMRVSTDAGDPPAADGTYDPDWDPPGGDPSQPSLGAAAAASRSRRWQHGRWWATDSECVLAGPSVRHRERWADELRTHPGLVLSGDRLATLDDRGRELTRALLRPSDTRPGRFEEYPARASG